eukprot:8617081-Pyramimonas_sp.AAC.1
MSMGASPHYTCMRAYLSLFLSVSVLLPRVAPRRVNQFFSFPGVARCRNQLGADRMRASQFWATCD